MTASYGSGYEGWSGTLRGVKRPMPWHINGRPDRALLAIYLFGWAGIALSLALGAAAFLHFGGVGWARGAAMVISWLFIAWCAAVIGAMWFGDTRQRRRRR